MKVEYIGEQTIASSYGHETYYLYLRINGKSYVIEKHSDSSLQEGHQLCLELERIMKDAFDTCGS